MHEPTAFYEWWVRLEARSMPWAVSSRSSNYDKGFFFCDLSGQILPPGNHSLVGVGGAFTWMSGPEVSQQTASIYQHS